MLTFANNDVKIAKVDLKPKNYKIFVIFQRLILKNACMDIFNHLAVIIGSKGCLEQISVNYWVAGSSPA